MKHQIEKICVNNTALSEFFKGLLDSEENKNIKGICYLNENMMEYKGIKITKRADNRYTARWTKDKQNFQIYAKTQKECYDKLKNTLKQENQIIKTNKNILFYDYCDKFLEIYKKPTTSKQTYATYKSHFKNHIKTNLPNIEINKITPLMINECISKCDGRTKEYVSQYLIQLFRQAYKDLILKNNIEESIIKFNHTRKEGTAFTREQRALIIEKSKELKYGYVFIFALYSGCRRSELLNIKISDIDYENNLLHIPGTKTTLSDRYIPIFNQLKIIIENIDKTNKTLLGISEKTLQRQQIELEKLIGFKIQFKNFRTTFGTMCAELGITDKTISKWMGHTTIQTTNKYYIKVLSDFEKQQANKLNQVKF